jgi:hypothetical protein
MFEEFQGQGPIHEDLLNFAATAKWLSMYHDANNGRDQLVMDMKEFFSQFDWYDPDITSYQTDYELDRDYNPKRCKHDDMQKYCIGLHECPYSIYGSLPFSEELYNRLGDE